MKILAFLQNPGFKPDTPDDVLYRYNTDDEFRKKTLKKYMTGQRLVIAFGEELFDSIIWDNVILATGTLRKKTPPDMEHVEATLREIKPDIVITFGSVAAKAMIMSNWDGPHFNCRHPNARGITNSELRQFAEMIKGLCIQEKRK